jgi:Sensors of blue-light using FAD
MPNPMSDATSQFLYLSRIKGSKPFETVSAIVAEARPRNARDGITGLLVFDGAQVCQYVEGGVVPLERLVRRLYADPRHHDLRVLHQGALTGARRFPSFSLGYLLPSEFEDVALFEAMRGEAAVQALLERLPLLDLET